MAETVTIHVAKTQLSRLVARAEAGEEIVIARGATPVAKLVPLTPREPAEAREGKRYRRFGSLKGFGWAGDEALEGWSEEELREWEEGHPDDPLNWPKDRDGEGGASGR
jgi:prevent-host-death family protein